MDCRSSLVLFRLGFIALLGVSSSSVICALAFASSSAEDDHLQRGNDALASGDFILAIQSYEACLAIDPHQRYCSINLASALIDIEDGQHGRERQERHQHAESLLRSTLNSYPDDGDAAFNLALLLQDKSKSVSNTREAARLYEIAAAADPERWDAWANLAAAQQEIGGANTKSVHAYERAILLLERMFEESRQSYYSPSETIDPAVASEMQAMNAYLSKLYYGYGTVLAELSPEDCKTLASDEQSLLIGKKHSITHSASSQLVCHQNAINAMRLASDLDPRNIVAAHMLAAMTEGEEGQGNANGSAREKRASNEFVSALFDDFADTFDEKLGALGYKVPKLVGGAASESLERSGRTSFHSALDAGCGTGLVGRFLRPLVAGPLVGVDLSKKMLELASKCTTEIGCGLRESKRENERGESANNDSKQLYDHLAALDLETMTADSMFAGGVGKPEFGGFDLIAAADVLVYFGDITNLLINFAKLSGNTKSTLIFSCERIGDNDVGDSGWKLQSSGRYAHSKSYVVGAAENAGYHLSQYEQIVPRLERGEEVKGHLFLFILETVPTVDVVDGDEL